MESTPTPLTTSFLYPEACDASASQPLTLLAMPDDVLAAFGEAVYYFHDLPSVVALSATCVRCRDALRPLAKRAREERGLRWDAERTVGHVTTNDGMTLTRLGGRWKRAWAIGTVLPPGRCRWRVRIDRCAQNEGVMCIGVCDAEARHAYGLAPYSGTLSCLSRDSAGAEVYANACPPREYEACTFTKRLLHQDLRGRSHGAVVEITVDSEEGTVHIGLRGRPAVCAIAGLPAGLRLRPWARLFDVGDRISCSGFWTPC